MDGCSTTISSGNFSSMPNTYGKIMVLKNLKGEINNSTIIKDNHFKKEE